MVAFYSGMRKGEINALKWSSITNDGVIQVRHSVAQKLKGGDRVTLSKNKTSIQRYQSSQAAFTALNEHRERYRQLNGFNDDYLVCGGLRCLRDSTIDNRNRMYAEAAGLKRIRIHSFRHSHASVLANAGISII